MLSWLIKLAVFTEKSIIILSYQKTPSNFMKIFLSIHFTFIFQLTLCQKWKTSKLIIPVSTKLPAVANLSEAMSTIFTVFKKINMIVAFNRS